MFIIFGTRYLDHKVEEGTRKLGYCSTCKETVNLVEYEGKKYFSLFFIPLIPIGENKRFLRCEGCNTDYQLVHDFPPLGEGSEEQKKIKVSCPSCRGELYTEEFEKEIDITCKKCGHNFVIRKKTRKF